MPRTCISRCRKRMNTGMRTRTVSMWSARLKTYASPAGSIPAGSSTGKTAGRKPPLIAGTGLRIRFRVRKKDLLSSCSPSACSRPSDSTPHPCCKPVKHTKGSRNRNAGNRNRKRRKSAGYVKSNISCCSMSINRNSWKGNGLRARCSLRLPNGTALKYISGPKACWAAA